MDSMLRVETFQVTKYYDTALADTLTGCVLAVDKDSKTLEITRSNKALQKINVANIMNASFGRKNGFLCIWMKGGVLDSMSPQPHQILLDISPDKDATRVAAILKDLRDWDTIASIYGARYDIIAQFSPMLIGRSRAEKEELIDHFIQSLKTKNDHDTASTNISIDKTLLAAGSGTDEDSSAAPLPSSPNNALELTRKSTYFSNEMKWKEVAIKAADSGHESQRRRSITSKDACIAKPTSSFFDALTKSVDGRLDNLIHQPAKRKRLDELDSSYSQALEGVETLKGWLIKSRSSSKSDVALIDRLEAENERLRTDLDVSKQQATSSPEFQTKVDRLTAEKNTLRTNYDESLAKVKQLTTRNTKLSQEKGDLEASVESLKSTKKDLTTQLNKIRFTLTAERDDLRETLTATELENDALKGLAEMFISGVNITELLAQVKAGKQFDKALRASMRNRGRA